MRDCFEYVGLCFQDSDRINVNSNVKGWREMTKGIERSIREKRNDYYRSMCFRFLSTLYREVNLPKVILS
jgi:hypothetical protein